MKTISLITTLAIAGLIWAVPSQGSDHVDVPLIDQFRDVKDPGPGQTVKTFYIFELPRDTNLPVNFSFLSIPTGETCEATITLAIELERVNVVSYSINAIPNEAMNITIENLTAGESVRCPQTLAGPILASVKLPRKLSVPLSIPVTTLYYNPDGDVSGFDYVRWQTNDDQ